MKNHVNPLILVTALFIGIWTCSVAQAERMTEPKGFVTFEMPAGWDNDRFKNGRHFTRTGLSEDPNILGVVPEARDKYMTLENMREGRKKTYAYQDHRLVFEKTTRLNDFEVWESVVEATIRKQEVVSHSYLLISDTLMVDVHLNVSKSEYEKYLPDLRSLFKSIENTGKAKLREF